MAGPFACGNIQLVAQPHGRDRLREERPDGTRVLACPFEKGWVPRGEGAGPVSLPLPGTAVDWDGEVFEVTEVEEGPAGGVRYVLEPWPEGRVLRAAPDRYDAESEEARRAGRQAGRQAAPASRPDSRATPSGAGVPVTVSRPSGPTAEPRPVPAPDLVRLGPWRLRRPVFALLVGLVPCLLLPLSGTPLSILAFPSVVISNGISYLIHELGHTAVFLFFGSAAVPAVVMTVAYEQSRWNVVGVLLGLAGLTAVLSWRRHAAEDAGERRRLGRRALAAGAVLAVYPFVALTGAHKLFAVLGGHLAETLVAAIFFRRAILGGLFDDRERPVWAALAWFLALANVRLFLGIVTSASSRTDYLSVSWTGGDNDLVVAGKLLDAPLTSVAAFMLLVSIVLPLAAAALALRRRPEG